jgi:hypothetical protein
MYTLPIVDEEFKALMPPLSESEYQQLQQSILACGECHDAILLWNNLLVDGFNRFCICVEHGIEFKVEEMEFSTREEAMLWIIEHQLGRRNLTDAARIELAQCRAKMLRKHARENQSKAGTERCGQLFTKSSKKEESPADVHKNTADLAGVGHGKLQRYNQIKKHAPPQMLEEVKTGKMKIGTAHKLLNADSQMLKKLKAASKTFTKVKQLLKNDSGSSEQLLSQLKSLAAVLNNAIKRVEDA